MARMIEYMPTAWRVFDRVRGIALSRDRFQFIFQREEDLQTVRNDRPWSYNHWTMTLERWTSSPPRDFLQTLEIWIRMRNIPAVFFTSDTMDRLASEIGKVEEIAYDPKVSHTKDYIRAKITFNVENPVKAFRKLTVGPGETVAIEFEYEKIHKRCFHCLRLTHEKVRCPLLKKGPNYEKRPSQARFQEMGKVLGDAPQALVLKEKLDGPPGFSPLFPELSKEDQKMAMMYISHSDPTERLARIQRVRQGIEENAAESSLRLTRITKELDKGKGHVFTYADPEGAPLLKTLTLSRNSDPYNKGGDSDEGTESSGSKTSACSAPFAAPPVFRLGPSSEGRVFGNHGGSKSQRKRPPSWKRKSSFSSLKRSEPVPTSSGSIPPASMKRKSVLPLQSADIKSRKISVSTVASVLKPLPPQ